MISVKKARAFGYLLYYAECTQCNSWVKSNVGQHVWGTRHQASVNARKHLAKHKEFST